MFTGLIEERGRLINSRPDGGGLRLEIAAEKVLSQMAVGDSIAVNGVCQTVTALGGGSFTIFAMTETLRATTLGELTGGSPVNLERALTPDARLGGHFVTGHVDGVGRITGIAVEGSFNKITLEVPDDLHPQLIPKGSIAVDGISLTIGPWLAPGRCDLFMIPHSLAHTTLGQATVGGRVNLETDLLGKYVRQFLTRGEGDRSGDGKIMNLLKEHGFTNGDE
jgi:riboflavin synthase